MPRKPKKQPAQAEAPKGFEEFVDEAEAGDEDLPDEEKAADDAKMRDWRDVEKYKEERALRRLIDDDLDFDGPRLRRR